MGRLRPATAVTSPALPPGAAFVTNVSVAAGRGDIFVWRKHNVRIKSWWMRALITRRCHCATDEYVFAAESQIAGLVQRSVPALGKSSSAIHLLSNKELPSFTVISFGLDSRRFLSTRDRYRPLLAVLFTGTLPVPWVALGRFYESFSHQHFSHFSAGSESFHGHSFSPHLLPACRMLPGLLPLLPLSHQDSRPEVVLKDWRVGDRIAPRSHFSAPIPRLVPAALHVGQNPPDRSCGFDVMVQHASADVLSIFTWNRKRVIWWRPPLIPDQPPLPWHQQNEARHQPSASGKTLFYQPTRAIVAFTSSVDGPGPLLMEAWVRSTTQIPPLWVLLLVLSPFLFSRWWSFLSRWLRLLPRGFPNEAPLL